jgi:hypothetical protein
MVRRIEKAKDGLAEQHACQQLANYGRLSYSLREQPEELGGRERREEDQQKVDQGDSYAEEKKNLPTLLTERDRG